MNEYHEFDELIMELMHGVPIEVLIEIGVPMELINGIFNMKRKLSKLMSFRAIF